MEFGTHHCQALSFDGSFDIYYTADGCAISQSLFKIERIERT